MSDCCFFWRRKAPEPRRALPRERARMFRAPMPGTLGRGVSGGGVGGEVGWWGEGAYQARIPARV